MNKPIYFKPIYQERVWGGRNLETALGRQLPSGNPIGESWEVVDRPEAQSMVVGKDGGARSLRSLIESDAEAIMGSNYDPSRPFPILIKWLDCADRLSLQVHPPASVAEELGGEPKTENWYIASCEDNASLIVGLKQGATKEEFERRLADNTLEDCVHRFPVQAGDSILVESGRLHAIDAGNLILEIQQNSDTTYRVYDWGRVGLDGQPRQLHVDQSLRCIDWNDIEPSAMKSEGRSVILADCAEFRIEKHALSAGGEPLALSGGEPRLLSVVEGSVSVGGSPAVKGDTILLPACADFELTSTEAAVVLVTDQFV